MIIPRYIPALTRVYQPLEFTAMLDIYNSQVLMNKKLLQYPDIVQDFVYLHEGYHIYNNTPVTGRQLELEYKCDEGAATELRLNGSTRTQIVGAMDMVLPEDTNEQIWEKKKRISNIEKFLNWMPS